MACGVRGKFHSLRAFALEPSTAVNSLKFKGTSFETHQKFNRKSHVLPWKFIGSRKKIWLVFTISLQLSIFFVFRRIKRNSWTLKEMIKNFQKFQRYYSEFIEILRKLNESKGHFKEIVGI